MKLYVVGTSPQANIRPSSQYVSGYHAELLLLDNGDVLLTDRGSKNGTYLNGKKLTPDKDVNVRRGDDVRFADAILDWSQIPSNTVDLSRVQEIRGIGSHYMNKIQLHGEHISRFHATLKKMKNGKWYIQDHSKNGTNINGTRIPKDQDYRIRRGDKITCAGVPVQNPIIIPEIPWGVIGSIIGVALCVILSFIIFPIKPDKRNSVVLLQCHYHYELIKDNKVEAKTKSYPYFGTGFFISKDGKIVTNLHIAKPWLFEEDDVKAIKTAYLTKEYGEMGALLTSGLYEVRGVMDYVAVYPHGSVYSEQNAIKAHVIAASENKDVDLAILQLDSNVLPSTSDYISVSDISKSADDVDVGDKVCAIGFPTGLYLQIEDDEQARDQKRLLLESYKTEGIVIRSGTDVNFEHNAMTEGGSSGSPIFDSRGNVVGVNSAHKSQAESNNYNIAIDAALIHGLLNRKVKY